MNALTLKTKWTPDARARLEGPFSGEWHTRNTAQHTQDVSAALAEIDRLKDSGTVRARFEMLAQFASEECGHPEYSSFPFEHTIREAFADLTKRAEVAEAERDEAARAMGEYMTEVQTLLGRALKAEAELKALAIVMGGDIKQHIKWRSRAEIAEAQNQTWSNHYYTLAESLEDTEAKLKALRVADAKRTVALDEALNMVANSDWKRRCKLMLRRLGDAYSEDIVDAARKRLEELGDE